MIHKSCADLVAATVEAPMDISPPPTAAPNAGWGRCRACDCMGFKDTGEDFRICDGCGHNWTEHR
jgi:hypothetical protein